MAPGTRERFELRDSEAPGQPLLSDTSSQTNDVGTTSSTTHDSVQQDSKHLKTNLIGYGVLLIGVFEYSFAQAAVQLLNRSIPHSELNSLRQSVQLMFALLAVYFKKCDLRIEKSKVGWAAFVFVVYACGTYGSYGSTFYLPIGVVSGVGRSSELLIFYMISLAVTRTMRKEHFIAVFVCLIGIILVLQPKFIFHHHMPPIVHNRTGYRSPCNRDNTTDISQLLEDDRWTQDLVYGYLLVYVEVIAVTSSMSLLKYKLHDLDSVTIVFWTSLIAVVISFALMGITETPVMPELGICAVFLACHILMSGTHNFLYLYAYQVLPLTMSAVLSTFSIPLNFVLQYTLLFGMYPGLGNPVEIVGALVVFVGNILIPTYELILYSRSK